jgi:hypothetical protein
MLNEKKAAAPHQGTTAHTENTHNYNKQFQSDNQAASPIRSAAVDLINLGFSVIPIMKGRKKAAIKWGKYQRERMYVDKVVDVFQSGHSIAIVCGGVSGNLECIDFDKPDLFDKYVEMLRTIRQGLYEKLIGQSTPSGGFHLVYRCAEPVSGNQKLAISKSDKTWIETRGQGGYVLACPSPGYTILNDGFEKITVLTAEERKILHSIAISFSEKKKPSYTASRKSSPNQRPGDDFNERADETVWRKILEQEGWTFTGQSGPCGEYLIRPGKDHGVSATLGNGWMYVFSTNTPLPVNCHLDAFSVYTHLQHQGDFSQAAKELAKKGYGNKTAEQDATPEWGEPLPLISKSRPEPYPIDALEKTLRDAVVEVQSFTKAPLPLVAASALSAISLAVQGHIDVSRTDGLFGPISLFMLTIADSGERKSTCDKYFTQSVLEYQKEQEEKAKPAYREYLSQNEIWEAKRAGLKAAIKSNVAAKKNTSTGQLEKQLHDLAEQKPEPPKVPRLIRGDETPENLSYVLTKEWPSGGIISSEAGAIFGSHGMGKDSIVRTLSLYNILWDGGELSIGRRTTQSYVVKGARLTVGLQVQETTLRDFLEKSGDLARGTGFLARFLLSFPLSTQGYRTFTHAPKNWPALTIFNSCIQEILEEPITLDDDGRIVPTTIGLDNEAQGAWVRFHDDIEAELKQDGDYSEVKDFASKIADNAARLAAIFEVIEAGKGFGTKISGDTFLSASKIARWYLHEARRVTLELHLPEKIRLALILDRWLLDHCFSEKTSSVSQSYVMQFGPNQVRRKDKLNMAIAELVDLDRIRTVSADNKKMIAVNPHLFAEVF